MSSTCSPNSNFYTTHSLEQTIHDVLNLSFSEILTDDPPPYECHVNTFPSNESSDSFDNPIPIEEESGNNESVEGRHDLSTPHIIFPSFYFNRLHSLPQTYSPHTIDQPPIGFNHELWTRVWYNQEFELDSYLENIRSFDNGTLLPWMPEYTFNGATYRLTISHFRQDDDLPIFKRGMTISFSNCNSLDYRYIIDHCVHIDDFNAYVKVVCFDSCQFYYDICSHRPPLILAIPKSHCRVQMHPNLEIHPTAPVSSLSKISPPLSFWRRLFHKK
jgi:hypothetical protein